MGQKIAVQFVNTMNPAWYSNCVGVGLSECLGAELILKNEHLVWCNMACVWNVLHIVIRFEEVEWKSIK